MKVLMKGNEAIAEAAIRAGCQMYVGYPITPQSEITEYMSSNMPKFGRTFIQSQSELISINTVLGGSMTGARCMTSSSGVGISLMQEGFTDAFSKALTPLIVNVNRLGCGMGCLAAFPGGQDDYTRETHGGGNGYYRFLVYIPSTIQEAVDMTYQAWDVAEKYHNPVELYTEGRLGQMMEAVELPAYKEVKFMPGCLDGTQTPTPNYPVWRIRDEDFNLRLEAMEENEQQWEEYRLEDAELVIVAVGLCARVCKGAINKLREQGVKIGMLRPKTVWPFPVKGFKNIPGSAKKMICVENSSKPEMLEDVIVAMRKVPALSDCKLYSKATLGLIPGEELMSFLDGVITGAEKEV